MNMTEQKNIERRATMRIRELLNEWAGWQRDKCGNDFPSQAAFVTERVQTSGQASAAHEQMPEEVIRLDREIAKLAPASKRIIAMEYMDRRPQKCKAAELHMPREVFSVRLRFIHEHLHHVMFCL